MNITYASQGKQKPISEANIRATIRLADKHSANKLIPTIENYTRQQSRYEVRKLIKQERSIFAAARLTAQREETQRLVKARVEKAGQKYLELPPVTARPDTIFISNLAPK